MNNLNANLYSLSFLATQIKLSVYTLEEIINNKKFLNEIKFSDQFLQERVKFPNSLRAIISEHSIIQFCSFLDEYKKFNHKHCGEQYKNRILNVRSKNKYGIQRINKWNNLYEYRNQIAAHNFDVKKESILTRKNLTKYNIPDALNEKYLFHKITIKICQNIFEEFSEYRDNFNLEFNLNQKIEISKNLNFNLENELLLVEKNM